MNALKLKLAWRAIEPDFDPSRGAPGTVSPRDLEVIAGRIETALRELPAFSSRPFELPPQLEQFYLLAGDRLVAGPRSTREAGTLQFYAASWLPTDGLHLADEAEGDSAPWLEIGAWDARTWLYICCDPEDELFGAVLKCVDRTPWSRVVYESETWPDLTAFLTHLGTP